jgi:hypothetical protein
MSAERSENKALNQDEAGLLSSVHALGLMETCKFTFRTLEDIRALDDLLNKFFNDKKQAMTGIHALMMNAVEHGNLGIGYERKAELLVEGLWKEEIQKRLEEPEHIDKRAELVLTRKDGGTYIMISDRGPGFNWGDYLKVDPGRAGRKHGRGIALAYSLSFDKLTYNDAREPGYRVYCGYGKV